MTAAAHLVAGLLSAVLAVQIADPPFELPAWPPETERFGPLRPPDPPSAWLGLIGEYGSEREPVYVFERAGVLCIQAGRGAVEELAAGDADQFGGRTTMVRFARDARGRATHVMVNGTRWERRHVGPADGAEQLHVTPVRPVTAVLAEARAATPPVEPGDFAASDLVEVMSLDPTIRLDVRYASTNNFLGSVFYAEPRVFLQRPAADAVVRVHRALRAQGYGLLLHDGYRPWYVTKAFWDATPLAQRWLVADPASGSRHNRGAAVDLTLYELATGRVVEMPSTYDESTPRAYAFYPGGTTAQRWHRAMLRRAMEAEGFTVNPSEWWHFDYAGWRAYRLGNVPFSEVR